MKPESAANLIIWPFFLTLVLLAVPAILIGRLGNWLMEVANELDG